MNLTVLQGHWLEQLRTLPDESAQMCVTSPPYWGLRSYLPAGHPLKHLELGTEKTPEEYVAKLVEGFREVRRVLKPDGTLWLNLGDSLARSAGDDSKKVTDGGISSGRTGNGHLLFKSGNNKPPAGLKAKDLVGVPWMVAFALRTDGWYLRSDIIWAKPNPMPESVTDRPTRSHEYLFLLTKSPRYYYDSDATKEPAMEYSGRAATFDRSGNPVSEHVIPGQSAAQHRARPNGDKRRGHSRRHAGFNDRWDNMEREEQCAGMRNKRDVWTIAPASFKEAHFATFPPDLIKPCILAGSKPGDTVLDPFGGSGTTGQVALEYGRAAIVIELNPDYIPMIHQRCNVCPGLPL